MMRVMLTAEAQQLGIRFKSLQFRQVPDARVVGIGRTFVGFVFTDVTPQVDAGSRTAREDELMELLVEVPNSDDLNACRELAAKRLHAQLLKLAAGLHQDGGA